MTMDEADRDCLRKPGAYLDYPFTPFLPVVKVKAPSQREGAHLRAAVFAARRAEGDAQLHPASAAYYRETYPGAVTRGWHCPPVMQPHFNTVSLDGVVPDGEIYRMIDHAWETVIGKYPKYIRRRLPGTQD